MCEIRNVNFMSWNADGVRTKIIELLDLAKDLQIDVLAVCETRLTPKILLSTPGYACYRLDHHPNGHGQGVAILIKANIVHKQIPAPATRHLEVIGIELELSGKKHKIFSIYQSPNLPLDPSDLDAIFKVRSKILVMGDFNCKHPHWNCTDSNPRGNMLFNHMLDSDYVIHWTPTPTLIHYHDDYKPSTPDLLLTLNVHNIDEPHTVHALSSNHLPITFSLSGSLTYKNHSFFRYNQADWNGFRSYLDEHIFLTSKFLSSTSEIDDAIQSFLDLLIDARQKFVPTGNCSSPTNSLPSYIKNTIKIKNRFRRWSQKESNPQFKGHLRTTFNHLQWIVNTQIREHNNNMWEEKLSKVDNPTSDLWRLAKSLRCKATVIPPLKLSDDALAVNTEDQCEALADAFQANMRLTFDLESEHNNSVQASVEYVNKFIPQSIFKPTRPKEIWCKIKQLKRRKSPGADGIHNALLKNLSQKSVIFLTKIFNACFRQCYFPQIWKNAKVIAILKPGKDADIPTSYRPISLLSSLSKLFEAIIYTRLISTTQNLLKNEQFGFRKKHSTTQQLARVAEHIAHHLNLNQSTGMFLLDIEKAFDTVWHDGLLHKLVSNDVPLSLIKLVQSYLTNRTFHVHIDDVSSSSHEVPAGVPQGSILGPYLFLLFLNDIPVQPRTKLACFADDTASLTSDRDSNLVINRLQLSLELLFNYFSSWKLKLNEGKTEAILFTRRRRIPDKKLNIGGHSIPWSSSVKYLGLHLDKKLNWSHHITTTRSKGIKALNALSPILNRKSNLSPATKLCIYTTLVRPCLTYAAPVWSSTCKTNYTKLQVIQNKALKMSYDTPFRTNLQKLHDKISLPLLDEFILKATRKFYLLNNPTNSNNLISSIGRTRLTNLPYIDKYRTYRLPHHLVLDE